MVPVSLVSGVLGDSGGSIDSENRPLSEDEENRLAWLGVEMQGMDPDLARASDVMDETNGGMSGGIVTYLYPNSPAASAGLQDGDIILRLHVEGQPKPLEVSVDDPAGFGMMEQFWANLDRVPEEYFDRLPRPWGNAENALTRALTDLGFGTPFVADIWRDGKLVKVPMTVTQGPAHYDAAARWKSESLGLTVRDLTYEVRRYFQMKDDEPGVIISKLEAGSKAAVAGLKPFETIRTINDQPVTSVKDFERLASGGGELKLAVKRMTQGRTVKIKTDAKPDAPKADAAPAEDDAKQ
jgi:serine protease Do